MRARSLVVIVLLGFSAALFSTLPAILSHPRAQFLLVSFEAGFPFQWYLQPASQGITHCGPTGHCQLSTFRNPSPVIGVLALLVDTSIYTLIAAGIVSGYHAAILSRSRKMV